MEIILACLGVSLCSGIFCYIVEKSEKIPYHIDKHRDPILAALSGAVTTFFASIILIMLTNLSI